MGIASLQEFIDTNCQQACKSVDLAQIARNYVTKRRGKAGGYARFCLVVDAESCMNRLYGGYFSDWVCGGQWNRMTEFLQSLIQACHGAGLEMVVFFNGGLENQRIQEWFYRQVDTRKRVQQVLKHIHNKATPPPKIWWVQPAGLGVCLRLALRHLGVTIGTSMDDHHQEVIAYCRENNLNGLLAQDAEYAVFDPPRFFSSQHLKLTFKHTLETQEYVMDEVAKTLDLHPKRFTIVAALLGNHILEEGDLKPFYKRILELGPEDKIERVTADTIVTAVVGYVRSIPVTDNLDEVGAAVFRGEHNELGKISLFKQSVQYYINGTQEGYLKYKPKLQMTAPTVKQPGSYPTKPTKKQNKQQQKKKTQDKTPQEEENTVTKATNDAGKQNNKSAAEMDTVYIQEESGYGGATNAASAPEIVIDPPNQPGQNDLQEALAKGLEQKVADLSLEDASQKNASNESKTPAPDTIFDSTKSDQSLHKLISTSSSSSSSSGSSPHRLSPEATWTLKLQTAQKQNKSDCNKERSPNPVQPEIMRIASERHQKGLLCPWVYQVLSQGEIKVGVTLEDELGKELPLAVDLYRVIRQHVYAILFDLNKKKLIAQSAGNDPATVEVTIKEWVVRAGSNYPRFEAVKARALDWKVPSISRLWLGHQIEDKNRRLRAFLTCMKSDIPLMLNTSYVPQHLLIMCCVLRQIVMYQDRRVLRKHELDAFLAQAVSPLLNDVQTMQEMKLPMITNRGCQLAALFMRGIETAVFANDACGAPIPWHMCCPWNFFDGKLFHYKLLKANNNTPLHDICDGHVEQVMMVERMRQAILEGLKLDFAKPLLPLAPPLFANVYPPGTQFRPAGAPPMHPAMLPPGLSKAAGRGRGLLGKSPVDSRGGQLQIAGVVVGQWGANTAGRPGGRGTHVAPQVYSVGPGRSRGPMARGMAPYRGGGGMRGMRGMPPMGLGRGLKAPVYCSPPRGYGMPVGRVPRGMRALGRVRSRGGRGYASGVRSSSAVKVVSAGRGCTVETTANGKGVVSVSQLLQAEDDNSCHDDDDDDDDDDDEDDDNDESDLQYEDALDLEECGEGHDLISPDSGINLESSPGSGLAVL